MVTPFMVVVLDPLPPLPFFPYTAAAPIAPPVVNSSRSLALYFPFFSIFIFSALKVISTPSKVLVLGSLTPVAYLAFCGWTGRIWTGPHAHAREMSGSV